MLIKMYFPKDLACIFPIVGCRHLCNAHDYNIEKLKRIKHQRCPFDSGDGIGVLVVITHKHVE